VKILAAVVTHNRCKLLGRCIDHLESQTRAPDQILIIDNASTDGTAAMLRNRGITFITQENCGSAGGWSRSIEYGLGNGFDAVWLMDDDGYPHEEALAKLEVAMKPEVACASSVVLREDMPTHFVFPFALLDRRGFPVILGAPRKLVTLGELCKATADGTYPFAYLFNGALIRLEAVRKIGNVNREFYLFGEEVDYFFRLRSVGKVTSVLRAVQFHPDVSQRPITDVKLYYYLKNTLVLNARHFNAVPIRNLLAVIAVLGRTAKRNGLLAVMSYLSGSRAPIFYLAILRGLHGKIGKDLVG
jgi:rhamnopyranosyl-N-acetylglucosaminyl-diphospho-decaprenol beta-1,3/1,4-galactofuranosyltransferase